MHEILIGLNILYLYNILLTTHLENPNMISELPKLSFYNKCKIFLMPKREYLGADKLYLSAPSEGVPIFFGCQEIILGSQRIFTHVNSMYLM